MTMSGPAHRIAVAFAVAAWVSACGGGAVRYQGVEPEELFRIAETKRAEGDHDDAIEALDRILVAHGGWERVPDARLMLADVYFEKEEYLTARAEYNRFLDRYAGRDGSAQAALGVCRSLAELAPKPQRDQGYTQEAMSACRNVVTDFAGREEAARAAQISNELRLTLAEKEFLTGDFYFRRNLFDSAIKYFEFVVDLYPDSEHAPLALLRIYEANTEIGYDDLAEEARDRLLAEYPDSEAAEELRTGDEGS